MIDGRRGRKDSGGEELTDPADPEELAVGDTTDEGEESPTRRLRLGSRLVAIGVTADQVTAVGVLLAALTGAVIALGHLYVGVALITIGGLMDLLDGTVAKAAGTSSRRGAFLDSVSDRVADGLIFGGVTWYLATGAHPGLALLPLGILAVGNVISYERAKAESFGWDAKGGLMERAERLIGLAAALTFNFVMVEILWLLLALCVVTAAQRFVKVWRQASAELSGEAARVHAERPMAGWRPGRVESRWREWREARARGARLPRRPYASSRVRSRRREGEPLSTRLRSVLSAQQTGGPPRAAASRQQRSARIAKRRKLDASAGLRRRFGTGR